MMDGQSPEMGGEQQAVETREFHFENLSFEDLERTSKEIQDLAKKSFRRTDIGFKNADGDSITVWDKESGCKLASLSDELEDVHWWISTHSDNSVIARGAKNKEEMMNAIESMLIELGNRIIE